jgi:prepilin-type N-terminal cleavage/methylation domain-containing protein
MKGEQGFTPSWRSAEHGFTLVELLVALVAGSMLLASLSWTLTSLGRELRESRLAEPVARADAAAPVVAGLIEQMFPAGKDQAAIVTEPTHLAFSTLPPAALGAVGPVRATLDIRGLSDGQALYATFEPVDPAAPFPAAARDARPLVEGYRLIRFDYQFADPRDEGMPPRLVTLSLVDRNGRATRVAATPRISSSGDCRFDPISMTCRR